mgnify:CR=1 FL=1
MATYAYKVKGRKLELLQQDVFNYWVTPLVQSLAGLKIEFTERAKFLEPTAKVEWDEAIGEDGPLNESAIVDIPEYLAKALVYYLKGRLAEDERDTEGREYNMHYFQKMIGTHENTKTHGMNQTMDGGWGIR